MSLQLLLPCSKHATRSGRKEHSPVLSGWVGWGGVWAGSPRSDAYLELRDSPPLLSLSVLHLTVQMWESEDEGASTGCDVDLGGGDSGWFIP